MAQSSQNIDLITKPESAIPNLHRFAHKAMATIYEIFIINDDATYAQQAAHEAFHELDRLEEELSRFRANSDITRINNLAAHSPLRLSLDTFECLQLAQRISQETKGAFDVTVGPLLRCWLNPDKTLRTPEAKELEDARRNVGMHLLKLDELEHTVTLLASPVHLDLGAIGKGYAVDVMANLLREWEIEIALLHGGRSSVYALGAPPETAGWPLSISNPMRSEQPPMTLHLCNRAVSGSGLQKGRHIIDPRSGQPLAVKRAAWAITPEAAVSDAISTAFMIMTLEEISGYCAQHAETRAIIATTEEEGTENFLQFGGTSLAA